MATAYPTAIDTAATTLPNPSVLDDQDAPGNLYHPTQHGNVNDAIRAIQARLGIGAQTQPVAGALLVGGAAGASSWSNTITVSGAGTPNLILGNTTDASGRIQAAAGNSLMLVTAAGQTLDFWSTDQGAVALAMQTSGVIQANYGLQVESGNLSVNGGASSDAGIIVWSVAGSASTQRGVFAQPVFRSTTTVLGDGVGAQVVTAASAFTLANAYTFHAYNPSKGSGSAIGTAVGCVVDPITAGSINNYGIIVNAPSGGSGQNLALLSTGAVLVQGTITSSSNGAGTGTYSNLISQATGTTTQANNQAAIEGDWNAAMGATSALIAGVWGRVVPNVNSTFTVARAASLYAAVAPVTPAGTLTNNNALFLETPSGGANVDIVQSSVGAKLTSAGAWTNASHEFVGEQRFKLHKAHGSAPFGGSVLEALKQVTVHHYDITDEWLEHPDGPELDESGAVVNDRKWRVADHDREDHIGYFAEELHAISPVLSRDGKGVDAVSISAFNTLAIQELLARVEQLEARGK